MVLVDHRPLLNLKPQQAVRPLLVSCRTLLYSFIELCVSGGRKRKERAQLGKGYKERAQTNMSPANERQLVIWIK